MTEQQKHVRNNDGTSPAKSPNDRNKKKSKDEENDPNDGSMDLEFDNLSPLALFSPGSTASSRDDDHASSNEVVVNPTDTNKPPNDQHALTIPTTNSPTTATSDKDNDSPSESENDQTVDLTDGDDNDDPFLANLIHADSPLWTMPIKPAERIWKSNPDWACDEPYLPNELDGTKCEYEDSLEYSVGIALDFVATEDNIPATISQWIHVLAFAFSKESDPIDDEPALLHLKIVRRMAVRLALTDPVELFPSLSWKNGALTAAAEHAAWIASYHIFGAPWKNRENWFKTIAPPPSRRNKRKPSTPSPMPPDPSPPKNVGFDIAIASKPASANKPSSLSSALKSKYASPAAKPKRVPTNYAQVASKLPPSTPTPHSSSTQSSNSTDKAVSNTMYLSKALQPHPRATAKITSMKDHGRKCRTYVKLKFSKFTSDVQSEQAEELSACFKTMMDKVWTIDNDTLVVAWKDGAHSKPLKSRSEFPKTKDGIACYVESLWMAKGKSAYCRSLLLHNVTMDSLFNDHGLQSWLSEMDLAIAVERIQAKKLCNVGHLLGYHALAVNVENLADAIQNQPALKNIAIEVRSEFVKFGNKKSAAPRSQTKILQLYTAWDSASRARRALVEIYSSRAQGQYPLGVQARFIPNVGDAWFIRTPESQLAYTNSLKKHVKFMNGTVMSPCFTIIEIDHFNQHLGMTLRQAIMHIFSSLLPECTLFVAVDTAYHGEFINFAYREELQNEAEIMISALPLFLYASLGHRSVWDWFTSDARHEASYYRWDMDLGIVAIDPSTTTDTKLAQWEQLDDVDDDDDDGPSDTVLQPFRLLLEETGKNVYGDHGTYGTQGLIHQAALVIHDDDSTAAPEPSDVDDGSGSNLNLSSVEATETTNTPSTLTKPSDEESLFAQMAANPDWIARFEAMMQQQKATAALATTPLPGTDANGS
jgi:hypothetical protein